MSEPSKQIKAWRPIKAPMGLFLLAIDEQDALHTDWPDILRRPWPEDSLLDESCCPEAATALEAYFEGESIDPALNRNVKTPSGPPFYARCWQACRTIRMGGRTTYADLAWLAGSPNAVRAAASSMRQNPLPIFVPCHRIIESGGGLGGFAGTTEPSSRALELKKDLLEFESTFDTSMDLEREVPALAAGGISCA